MAVVITEAEVAAVVAGQLGEDQPRMVEMVLQGRGIMEGVPMFSLIDLVAGAGARHPQDKTMRTAKLGMVETGLLWKVSGGQGQSLVALHQQWEAAVAAELAAAL